MIPAVRYLIVSLMVVDVAAHAERTSTSLHHHQDSTSRVLVLYTFEDAVNALAFFQNEIDNRIADEKLDELHGLVSAARDAATSAVALSPSNKRDALRAHENKIKATATQLDKYGEAEKANEASVYALKLRNETEALVAASGIQLDDHYIPRTPDGGSFVPHADHQPKHGGIFFMAPDQYHHLEGCYVSPGEFRLYLYDDHTRPLSSKGFSGTISFKEKEADLQPDPDGVFLLATLQDKAEPPVSLSVKLKIPSRTSDKISTEQFDFDFDKLSQASTTDIHKDDKTAAPARAKRIRLN